MDTSNSIPPTVDEKGKEYVDTQKIKNHMESPVEKDTRTKAEIADTFESQEDLIKTSFALRIRQPQGRLKKLLVSQWKCHKIA